jgi:AcrR family transcriptional regulator
MTPRKYKMTKRAEATAATRERIVAATVAAHRDLGIQATSWEEIARRAEVGVGTVYRHFPSLDELLPACGELVTATLALPQGEQIARVFAGARSRWARIERLVEEVFKTYQRGGPFIENIRRERRELAALEQWHRQIEDSLDALVREALGTPAPAERTLDVVRALIDLSTWNAFRARGFTPEQAAHEVCELIGRTLRLPSRPTGTAR